MLIKLLPLYLYLCVFPLAEALKEVAEIAAQLQSSLIRLENFQKLTELQRDLIGIENLTAPGRVSPLSAGQGAWLENLWELQPRWNLTSISVLFFRNSYERAVCTSSPRRGCSSGCSSWFVVGRSDFKASTRLNP